MSRFDHSPLAQLTLARLREVLREPEAVFWTFFFPILIAVALGLAFRERGAQRVYVAVESTSEEAGEIAAALAGVPGIRVALLDPATAADALRNGDVALVVKPGRDLILYRYDPTRPESRTARLAANDALQRAAGRADFLPVRDDRVVERGSRYIDWVVPGLIGLNLLAAGLWGVGYTVVRMRMGRLIKRLVATPMRRGHMLLSFIIARLAFLPLEIGLVLLFARLAFDVRVEGSILDLAVVAVLGGLTFSGLGMLLASRARTIEGVSGLMNLTAVPMWLLSGVFFSSDHFPQMMQPFIRALPLTAVNDALRAVMLEGDSLLAIAGPLIVVAAWGAGSFVAALAIFRWR